MVGLRGSKMKAKVNFPQAYTRALLVTDWLVLLCSDWLISIRVCRRIRCIEIHGKSDVFTTNYTYWVCFPFKFTVHKGGHGKYSDFAFEIVKIKPFLRFGRLTRLKNESKSELPAGLHSRRLVGFAAIWLVDLDPSFSRKSVLWILMELWCFYYKLDILGSFIETTTTTKTR